MRSSGASARGRGILAAGAAIQLLTGLPAAWGVFQQPVMEEYALSEAGAAAAFSVLIAAYGAGCVAGGFLQDRRGPRCAALWGAALLEGGLWAAAALPGKAGWAMPLAFSLPAGLGTAFLYPAIQSCAQKWYAGRKGMATGVIGAAAGLSGAFLALFVHWAEPLWGVRGVFRALGALCGLPKLKILKREDMFEASSLVGVTFFFLMARYGTLVGPSFWKVVESGPALILQEFGNIGTVFFGVPIAVLLGLKREAVGAAFSNAREPNIAIIGEKYGLDTPEGRGVMGVYVTGTVFGAIFCSLLSSFVASTMPFFSPQALAMATGTGSAGMMTAALAPLVEMYPDIKDELTALAAASNMFSGLDGVYMCVFMSLPLANWLVRKMGVKDAPSVPTKAGAQEGGNK